MSDPSDEWVSRARRGDAEALSRLLETCGPRLADALAGRIGQTWRSLLDVDDVIQVTFLEAFLRIDSCTAADARSFLAWVTRIAEHNLTDAVRELGRAKRHPPGRQEPGDDGRGSCAKLMDALTGGSTPSQRASRNEACAAIEKALTHLPPDYQKVIRLYDLEGRTAREVSEAMGRTQGAVHMLRARAHDRLRQALGSESRYFSDTA